MAGTYRRRIALRSLFVHLIFHFISSRICGREREKWQMAEERAPSDSSSVCSSNNILHAFYINHIKFLSFLTKYHRTIMKLLPFTRAWTLVLLIYSWTILLVHHIVPYFLVNYTYFSSYLNNWNCFMHLSSGS